MFCRCLSSCAALAALLLTVFAPTLWPQQQQQPPRPGSRLYEIRGWVRYADSMQPADMTRVDLTTLTRQIVATVYTRANGGFEFQAVPPGEYVLVVTVEGFEPVREPVEVVIGSRVGIQLFLQPIFGIEPERKGGTVGVRELGLPKNARAAFQRGLERLYRRRDPKGSLPQFERAIAEYPGYYEAHHALGVAHLHLGNNAAAEQAFQRALAESQQTYAPAFVSLAGMCNNEKKYQEALVLARRAVALDAESFEALFELSRALFYLGRTAEAEVSMRETQRRRPDFPDIYLLYANLSIRKHDLPGLILSLEEFLKLEPAGPNSDYARKMLAEARKRANEAAPAAQPRP